MRGLISVISGRRFLSLTRLPGTVLLKETKPFNLLGRVLAVLAILFVTGALAEASPTTAKVDMDYGRLPLSFVANGGQFDPEVKFVSRGRGRSLFLKPQEAVLTLYRRKKDLKVKCESGRADMKKPESEIKTVVLRMSLKGADKSPNTNGLEELSGKVNYLIGKDPNKWRTNLPTYAKVKYSQVYAGIDLVYYGNQQKLEYDFMVSPGVDPSVIRLRFEGMDDIEIDRNGNLVLTVDGEEIHQLAPKIYQEIDGKRIRVAGGYVLQGKGEAGFRVAAYDVTRTLVIDPVLEYSTYLGGGWFDYGHGIAVDSAGSAYITGEAGSTEFPNDAFVTKLSASGNALEYSTYLGGSSLDSGYGLAVDSSGAAYITGYTESTDFPTHNAHQASYGGGHCDAFVTKLSPAGNTLEYSTYLGGNDRDWGNDLAVDSSGAAYITGETWSTDFPTHNAYQASIGIGQDAFVTKVSASGNSLEYSTYLGGNGEDSGAGIAVDSADAAYITGHTGSLDFPTHNAYQANLNGGILYDAFVTKLSASGSTLDYSTYLGGYYRDSGNDIALDSLGAAYITGQTQSTDFPTQNAYQASLCGGTFYDAFVTKLSSSGNALEYSTYLGGSYPEYGMSIAVDSTGAAYITGDTSSTDFPLRNACQASPGGERDAFVAKLSTSGNELAYSTYLGGSDRELVYAIAVDSSGATYITGETESPDFPTRNAYQASLHGLSDIFVTKLVPIGTEQWRFQTGDYVGSSPAIGADGTIYVGNLGGYLWAINPDGTQKWRFQTGDAVNSSPSIGADGTIYLGSTDGYLYAINPDGTQKWRFQTGDKVSSSPAIGAGGTIYVGSEDSCLYAINPDGTQKWRIGRAGYDVSSSPAIGTDGTIYVGFDDGHLWAINPNGTQKWWLGTGDDIDSSPAIGADGTIYVGSEDSYLYAINPDGTQKWRFQTGNDVDSSPAISADGTIYVGSKDNHLYAINPDGTQKWRFETGSWAYSSPAIGADGTIYIGSMDNYLYAINPDGTQKWRFETGDKVSSSPAIGTDGTIYVGSDDKCLYAINGTSGGLADTPWPMFHHNLRHTGLVNIASAAIDFNNDGKSDILYRHPGSGKVGVWLMDGITEDTWALIGNYGPAWDAGGVGDFNGDGSADIVFRNNNGVVGVWLMDGTKDDTWQPLGDHGTFWNVKGVGDFDNNGQVDVVYQNNSGVVGIWLMNGTTEAAWRLLGSHGTTWDVKGVGDFNGDGSNDVVYSSTSGMVGIWLMNGTTEDTWVPVANHGPDWQPESVGDYNNDGKADIVFQNANGMVGIWLMDGTTEDTWQRIGNHGDWEVR